MSGRKVLALILAGGAGGRLDVLTEERAKPAMPFGGTYRLIDFALSNCMHSRLSDVWVIEQYQPHTLNDHLANGRPWDLDRTYGGLRVLPPYSGREEGGFAQGNADAIYRQRAFISEFAPDLIVVLSADHSYKLDYSRVIDYHLERQVDLTIVTTRVPLKEASRFGVVKTDDEGRVTDFAYKPENPESDIVTTEIFVYDASRLLKTLEELADEAETADGGASSEEKAAHLKDFGHKLLPRLVEEGCAVEFRFDGYWRDLGTIQSYWQAHMDLLAPDAQLDLDEPQWPILTYGAQRMPAHVYASARIENSLISPGCIVRGRVERSVLAPGVVIEDGATVRDSVLLRGTRVSAGAQVDCSIIDEDVTLDESGIVGERLREGATAVDVEIAVLGSRVHLNAGGRVEAGARIKPDTTV